MNNQEEKKSGLGIGPDHIQHGGESDQSGSETGVTDSQEHPISDPILLDPDDVCRQLESVNLTEEDTELLLKDALELNKILKAHLSKQEGSPTKKNSKRATPEGKKSKKPSLPGEDLPPLDLKRGLSAAQMRIRQPPQTQSGPQKKISSRSIKNGEESKAVRSKTASSTSSRKRSKSRQSSKVEWSDRW